jgi:RNA-splicing ligase RtcB
MGTNSYILHGTEEAMKESFGSCAHGAGRLMSRFKANKEFTTEGVTEQLASHKVEIKAASKKGITEEAPGAYKDVDQVIPGLPRLWHREEGREAHSDRRREGVEISAFLSIRGPSQ